ncbi:MAG: hypothetical protein K6T90_02760 [Leptolyngbyaceae cyanobacterium HOT.MB2.61]|jgi:hypothetical protein|nr:hypothetical protein [Leptolyngbyaceae cyanobacterium HOT.MB2.61]
MTSRAVLLRGFWVGLAIALLPLQPIHPIPVPANPPAKAIKDQTPRYIRPHVTCPANVELLTTAMLRDLPGYINRLYIRLVHRKTGGLLYAIAATQPDLVPLPAESSEYPNPADENLHQIFFTVLERQYFGQQIVEFQHYHWLFLTRTIDGWKIALMFSRFGSYPASDQPITPPRDSSQSLTAQAIQLWLRDCQAGSVKL